MNRHIAFLYLLLLTINVFGEDSALNIGDEAPAFTLQSDKGDTIRLSDYRGKYVVLVFYPGNETPVCTKQLCEIRDDYSQFEKKNAVVFGINPGSMKSHKKFADKYAYPFPLLVDESKEVAKKYGVKGFLLIKRKVFVIGPDGILVYIKKGKPPVSEILENIK